MPQILLPALVSMAIISSTVPHSSRSRAALTRVKTPLQKQLKSKGLQWGSPIFIRIFKESNELELWLKKAKTFKHFKTYPICYYSGALGPKVKEGDGQSPEGFYFVTRKQMNPVSSFHLSFNLGYPNRYEKTHGRTGSFLMVHGNCVSIGCFAMTDEKIEEIYALAEAALNQGQGYFRVHSFPFRMTPKRMAQAQKSHWYPFWTNLKEGFDIFESTHIPPNVEVSAKRYVFNRSN